VQFNAAFCRRCGRWAAPDGFVAQQINRARRTPDQRGILERQPRRGGCL